MLFTSERFDRKSIQKLIVRRHPDYEKSLAHWGFLRACYEGGPDWFSGNIFRYLKEGDKEFKDRVKRAYRFNHTREIVDLVNKYLYRTSPQRNENDASDNLKKFWEKATINNLDIDELSRAISTQSSICGRVWIVVDNTSADSITNEVGDVSVYNARQNEARVYGYIVTPENVLDMSYDDNGILNWILIREIVRDDADPLLSTGKTFARYRLWTRNQWFLMEPRIAESTYIESNANTQGELHSNVFDLIDSGDHNLGKVPVIPADNNISHELYTSPSLVSDVAYLDRACANYASNLDAIIQDQTFSQLAMPAQGLLPGDDEYKKLLELGTKRIFIYDGESGAQPFFLSPDPRQASLISSAIHQIIGEIYHSVGLGHERSKDVGSENADKASGVAKAKDFERVSALLKSKADAMSRIENEIAELVCLWNGESAPNKELIEYPTSFDTRELFDEFHVASQLSLIQMPPLVRSEQMKSMLDKLFPKIGEDIKKKMISEIEDWAAQEEEMSKLAKQGLLESGNPDQDRLVEEAKRNRTDAGTKQSRSKEKTGDSKKADSPTEGTEQ